jgi:hypothetical protein
VDRILHQLNPVYPLRSILILCPHLCLGLPRGPFIWVLQTHCMHFSFSDTCYMYHQSRPWFNHPDNIKGKVVPVLNKALRHEVVWGSQGMVSRVLILGARCRWVVCFMSQLLYSRGNNPPGIPWIGGWVGSIAGLDAMVKRKIPSSRRESNPKPSRYADWAIAARNNIKGGV